MEPLLYKIPAAAEVLGIGRSTLYELVAEGAISTVSIGRSRRITAVALAEYVASLESQAAEA